MNKEEIVYIKQLNKYKYTINAPYNSPECPLAIKN